jgi:hypothetical protein
VRRQSEWLRYRRAARSARLRLPEADLGGYDQGQERTPALRRGADRRGAGARRGDAARALAAAYPDGEGGQVAAAGTIGAGAIGAIQGHRPRARALVGVVPYLDAAKWRCSPSRWSASASCGGPASMTGAKACADGTARSGLAASQCAHNPGMTCRRGRRGRGSVRRPAGRPQCRACRDHAADGGGAT